MVRPAAPLAGAPIATALAACAAGVLALQLCSALPPAPGWQALASVVATLACARAGHAFRAADPKRGAVARWWAVALVVFAGGTGFGYAAWRAQLRLADALPAQLEGVDLRIAGVVDELPQPVERGVRFAFAVESVATPGATVPRRLSLGWYAPTVAAGAAPAPVPAVHAGERWQLTVRLKRPHGYVNPAGFDLEAWLLEHDLRATGTVAASTDTRRVDSFAGRFTDHVQRARERIRSRIASALPEARFAGVLIALTIGDQRSIPEAQWLVFNRTGVSHLISISGLHVTAFATLAGALVLALARRCTRLTTHLPARKIAVAVGALLSTAYVLLAGAEVPALRTLAMLVVAAAGLWLDRPGTALCVWLWSLVAVLALDPWAGFAPGFWLSFGAVGLLLYVGSGRLGEPPAIGWRARCLRTVTAGAATQWAITIGLVPATLALFQQVSLVSALANALAIPVVTLLVVPLCLAGIVVPLDVLWITAHAMLSQLMELLEWMAGWPGATWSSHAPADAALYLALAGVALMLAPRGLPGRGMGAAWLLPLALVVPPRPPPGAVRITALDIGQGLAVLVETAQHTLLFDTGPKFSETSDAGGRLVAPVLRAAGVGRLDALVVSHSDADHAGGALSILAVVPAARLWSSLAVDHPIVVRASAAGTAWRCAPNLAWEWDEVRFALLHPQLSVYADAGVKPNDRSCVLRIESRRGVALLAGDIEARSEAQLLEADAARLRADVVVVPHHGSRTSSTPAFVAAVAPAVAIISAGYRNRFGHPRADVVARWTQAGAAVHRTDREGAVSLTLGADVTPLARGAREMRPRYWRDIPQDGP